MASIVDHYCRSLLSITTADNGDGVRHWQMANDPLSTRPVVDPLAMVLVAIVDTVSYCNLYNHCNPNFHAICMLLCNLTKYLFQLSEQLKTLKCELDSRENDLAHLRWDNLSKLYFLVAKLVGRSYITPCGYSFSEVLPWCEVYKSLVLLRKFNNVPQNIDFYRPKKVNF